MPMCIGVSLVCALERPGTTHVQVEVFGYLQPCLKHPAIGYTNDHDYLLG